MIIIKKPESVINGELCRYPAGYNPCYFQVAKQDFQIASAESYTYGENDIVQLNLPEPVPVGEDFQMWANEIYVRAVSGYNVYIEGIYDNFPLLDGSDENVIALRLTNLAWSDIYSGINDGYANMRQREKTEVVVTGAVQVGGVVNTFTPRRFSFDAYGNCNVYVNAIVQDYFSKQLKVEDGYCVGQTVKLALNLKDDQENEINIGFDEEFNIVKAVRQLGQDKRLHEYMIQPVTTHTLTFHVTDASTTNDIEGAEITIWETGQTITTNSDGLAEITLVQGYYEYEVYKEGYNLVSETISINHSQIIEVELQEATEGFRTYDGTNLREYEAGKLRIYQSE